MRNRKRWRGAQGRFARVAWIGAAPAYSAIRRLTRKGKLKTRGGHRDRRETRKASSGDQSRITPPGRFHPSRGGGVVLSKLISWVIVSSPGGVVGGVLIGASKADAASVTRVPAFDLAARGRTQQPG